MRAPGAGEYSAQHQENLQVSQVRTSALPGAVGRAGEEVLPVEMQRIVTDEVANKTILEYEGVLSRVDLLQLDRVDLACSQVRSNPTRRRWRGNEADEMGRASIVLDGRIGELRVPVIVDTGAQVTAISDWVYHKLGRPALTPVSSIATGAGGSLIIMGAMKVDFTFGTKTYPFRAWVVKGLKSKVLLGQDFGRTYPMIIETKTPLVTIEGTIAPLLESSQEDEHISQVLLFKSLRGLEADNTPYPTLNVVAGVNLTISPNSLGELRVRVAGSIPKLWMEDQDTVIFVSAVEMDNRLGTMIASALKSGRDLTSPFHLGYINVSGDEVSLLEGQLVARAMLVTDGETLVSMGSMGDSRFVMAQEDDCVMGNLGVEVLERLGTPKLVESEVRPRQGEGRETVADVNRGDARMEGQGGGGHVEDGPRMMNECAVESVEVAHHRRGGDRIRADADGSDMVQPSGGSGRTITESIAGGVKQTGDGLDDILETEGAITQSDAKTPSKNEVPSFNDLVEGVVNGCRELTSDQKSELATLLLGYETVLKPKELGVVDGEEFSIHIPPWETPVKLNDRRWSVKEISQISEEIDKLLKAGFIEPANGPWASRLVLVVKKDGTTRVCVDYRGVNDKTISDAYPTPVLDQVVGTLAGNMWFTTLDAEKGYYQVKLSDKSKAITAFTCPFGLFQWTKMPFGLKNAPAFFQRIMDMALRGLSWKICMVFFDDMWFSAKLGHNMYRT